jgi:hypothetical protein
LNLYHHRTNLSLLYQSKELSSTKMATFQTRNGRTRAIIRRPTLSASKTFATLADARLWARAREREADLSDVLPGKAEGTLGDLLARYEREIWPLKKWGRSKAHELKVLDADLGRANHGEWFAKVLGSWRERNRGVAWLPIGRSAVRTRDRHEELETSPWA